MNKVSKPLTLLDVGEHLNMEREFRRKVAHLRQSLQRSSDVQRDVAIVKILDTAYMHSMDVTNDLVDLKDYFNGK